MTDPGQARGWAGWLTGACVVLAPLPAFCHAFLDGALPPVGSTSATAPHEVVLHFTEAVEPAFCTIEVRNGSGTGVAVGAAHVEVGDETRLAIGLGRIGPGTYRVIWHVTSVDAHKTQGTFRFTVRP